MKDPIVRQIKCDMKKQMKISVTDIFVNTYRKVAKISII